MIISDLLAALLVGFLGSAHCIGMCGGIASALSINSITGTHRLLATLLYNLGRIISYVIAGTIVGGTISSVASLASDYAILNSLRVLSALVMIILALYIGKWWHGLVYIEKLGQYLWRYLSPLSTKLLPLPTPLHALPLGLLWGWLPCGLVYSALTWSAVSGSALNGAAIMLAFGIGTLPSMLLIGVGAAYISKLKNSAYFRQTGAVLLLSYGIYIFAQTVGFIL